MLINITPIHSESRNCYEDIIASVAKWWGRDYELMFIEAWGFSFMPPSDYKDKKLGDILKPNRGAIEELLEMYHGIRVTWHDTKSARETFEIIIKELNIGKPVCINIDKFYCPWGNTYKNEHDNHYCMVIGHDEASDSLVCCDPFFREKSGLLNINDFTNGCGAFATFELLEPIELGQASWRKIIYNSITRLNLDKNMENNFVQMTNFAHAILNDLNLEKEIEGYKSIWFCPLFLKLRLIANGRKLFSASLKYLADRFDIGNITPMAKALEQIGKQLSTIQAMLVKACYTLERDPMIIKAASERLVEAARLETEIANALYKLSTQTAKEDLITACSMQTVSGPEEMGELIYLDISKHFNNKGFGDIDSRKSDLSKLGHFLLNNNQNDEIVLSGGEMSFHLAKLKEECNDNISCKGQEIPVAKEQISQLMVLGCSDFGDACDSIIVKYKNGEKEQIQFEFPNWSNYQDTDCVIIWQGKAARRMRGQVNELPHKAGLFGSCNNLSGKGTVESIVLPYCPGIHIFAISINCKK